MSSADARRPTRGRGVGLRRDRQGSVTKHIAKKSTIGAFFDDAELNPHASLIKGVICGYRVEEIEDPLTQKARYMDKLVDELAKGKKMEKILRS